MLQKKYRVARELPFIPVGGEITYKPEDNKYHYGYFAIPAELIGKTDFFEEIPTDDTVDPLEEIQQLIDDAKKLRLQAHNKLGHYKQQQLQQKSVENVRQIEGIYQSTCTLLSITNVEMRLSGTDVQFARTDIKKESPALLRGDLEKLNLVQLSGTISLAVRSVADRV